MKVIDASDMFPNLPVLNTEQYYVVYIDFLGAKNIITQDKEDKFLNDLNNIYKNAIWDAKEFTGTNLDGLVTRIFSDNILFAIKIGDNFIEESHKMLMLIQLAMHFQVRALKKGYLVRGGIAKGSLYHCNDFIYGKGLVDAVLLEEQAAIYPRIILQDGLETFIGDLIIRDEDGACFINYYHQSPVITTFAKPNLIKMLQNYSHDQKIKQKIMWAIIYHNSFIKRLLTKNDPHFDYTENLITNEEIKK